MTIGSGSGGDKGDKFADQYLALVVTVLFPLVLLILGAAGFKYLVAPTKVVVEIESPNNTTTHQICAFGCKSEVVNN